MTTLNLTTCKNKDDVIVAAIRAGYAKDKAIQAASDWEQEKNKPAIKEDFVELDEE